MLDSIPNLGENPTKLLIEKYNSLTNYNSQIINILTTEKKLSSLVSKINQIITSNPERKIWLKNTSIVTDPGEHEGAQEFENFDDFPMEEGGRRVPYMEVSVLTHEGVKFEVDNLTKETRDFTGATFIDPSLYNTLSQYCQD